MGKIADKDSGQGKGTGISRKGSRNGVTGECITRMGVTGAMAVIRGESLISYINNSNIFIIRTHMQWYKI